MIISLTATIYVLFKKTADTGTTVKFDASGPVGLDGIQMVHSGRHTTGISFSCAIGGRRRTAVEGVYFIIAMTGCATITPITGSKRLSRCGSTGSFCSAAHATVSYSNISNSNISNSSKQFVSSRSLGRASCSHVCKTRASDPHAKCSCRGNRFATSGISKRGFAQCRSVT